MPCTKNFRRTQARWGATTYRHVDSEDAHRADIKVLERRELDKIPRLMHQLRESDHDDSDFRWDTYFLEKERYQTMLLKTLPKRSQQNRGRGFVPATPMGSLSCRERDEDCSDLPPPPPRRALELVKEGVHRALQAFSTRPLKGFAHPPRSSDLLRPFDSCEDGRVTYQEFQAGLRGLGLGLTANESESLARGVDSDDTGLVDRKKFESEAIKDWGRESVECRFMPTARENGPVDSCLGKENAPEAGQRSRTNEDLEQQHKRENASRKSGKRSSRTHDGQGQTATGDIFAQERQLPSPPFEIRGKANTRVGARGRSRTPTVSSDQWQQMARRRGIDGPGPPVSGDNNGRTTRSRADYTYWDSGGSVRVSGQDFRSLNTLRSLLGRDGLKDEVIRDRLNLTNQTNQTPRLQRRGDYLHRLQCHRHEEGDATLSGAGPGNIKERRRNASFHGERHLTRPSSAPTGTGSLKGRGIETPAIHVENALKRASAHDRSQAYAARAEKTLMLRSRENLMGLRKAFSRADLSGSGVLTPMEMERSILRRFGAGLGVREARALVARYRKDYRGHSMVDYGRLLDNLEVVEAGSIERAVEGERPLRRKSKANNPETMGVAMPSAAGSRPRDGNMRHSKRVHDTAGSALVGKCAAEESQLVRRARAKTLALLEWSGTRGIDRVFGLIDSARSGIVSSNQFRRGLKILGGTDPLSDMEYKALFGTTCMGPGRIKYRDVIHTLSSAKSKESWEGTQRELARQAELPSSGRGSGVHLRHSNVLDYAPEGDKDSAIAGLSGARRHKDWRRRELVLQRLRNSVKRLQDGRDGAGSVYDMFQGQGGELEAYTVENQGADCDLPCLPPSALRRGLSSLGVPLGDEDFLALMATVDPERRGEVSYAGFCETLRLHKLCDNHGATVATQRTSATPILSSQSIGQGLSTGGVADAGGKGESRERGVRRAACRRALGLATHAEMNLDGGIFHRNPATVNCINPTFTTTMVKSCGDEKYCPRTRQPPALARPSGNTLPGDLTKKGFVREKGRSPQRWSETVEEAEVAFRRCLGMKIRTPRPYSSGSSCIGRHEFWDGWDSIGVSSPRRASSAYAVDSDNIGNRRGRVYTPKDNDLGFGSERMLLDSRRGHPCVERFVGGRPSRSLKLDAQSRYGKRARSTVHYLLRDPSWIEACPRPSPASSRSGGMFFHEGGGKDKVNGFSQAGWDASLRRASGQSEQFNGVTISRHPPQSPPKWISNVSSVAVQGGFRSGGNSRSDGSENTGAAGTRVRGRGVVTSGHRFDSSSPIGYKLRRMASAVDAHSLSGQGRVSVSKVLSGQGVSYGSAYERTWKGETYGGS